MFLIDTNVLSELPRARPDRHLIAWFELLPEFALSAIAIEELSYGVAKARGKTALRLREWFNAILDVPPLVVPVDARIAQVAGELRATRDLRGRRAAQADMLIAATALVGGFTLATRNIADFEGCGISIINPFR